jgi:signal transduction histidine kinase
MKPAGIVLPAGLVIAAALLLALAGSGCTSPETVPAPPGYTTSTSCPVPVTPEALTAGEFVTAAANYARCAGKDAALATFNDPEGPFTTGDRYIFADSIDGVGLASPYNKDLLGVSNLFLTDGNGVKIEEEHISVARRGGGMDYYLWPSEEAGGKELLKLTTIEPVDPEWFVASGEYISGYTPDFSAIERETLVSFVERARDYAREQGREKSLEAFNNASGEFVEGDLYVFAYDTNGTNLALPFQPDLIGKSRWDLTDANGVLFIRGLRDTALSWGGGFYYYTYQNPAENFTEELKLSYVLPVDDTWFVGSGVYGEPV